jgi:hypothetical protein
MIVECGKRQAESFMRQMGIRPQSPQLSGGPAPEPLEVASEETVPHTGELPAWVDKGFPWFASALLHLGLLILIFFAAMALHSVVTQQKHPIIVPQAWNQHFSTHPGGNPNSGQNQNPLQKARQNIRHILSHYANTNETSVAAVLNSAATKSLNFIAVGPQGGAAGGALASYGIPGGGMGSGPPSRFLGRGGNAIRIVYIIDHSGLMLYNFQFVVHEIEKSVDAMVPIQQFAVILVGTTTKQLGALGMVHATMPAKIAFKRQLSTVAPGGHARGRLAMYANAFRMAFNLHPQIIYFVTNGGFRPALAESVKEMNAHVGTHVFTYTFLNGHSSKFLARLRLYSGALKKIAKETGGQYRLIKE